MPRKNSRTSRAVVVRDNSALDHRVALPLSERHLKFSDKWGYAPAPEAHSYIKLRSRYGLFIDGKFVRAAFRQIFRSINPATEEKLAEISRGQCTRRRSTR